MKNGEETLWTIDELGERVAEALGGPGYDGVPSGRVRDVPDLRTIRYYTTLGLLDRPAAMRGRTALYGPRHLLQLVAIKRLQARGLSSGGRARAGRRAVRRGAAATRRGRRPRREGPLSRHRRTGVASGILLAHSAAGTGRATQPPARKGPSVQRRSRWSDGLVLSLAAGRTLNEDDLRVIRMAAAPLIEILRLRGLIGIGPSRTKERRRAMTMTRSRPLPLLDEVPFPVSDDRSERRRRLRRPRDRSRPSAAGRPSMSRAGSTACCRR